MVRPGQQSHLITYCNIRRVVVEDSWRVLVGELVLSVREEHAGLAYSPISQHHTLDNAISDGHRDLVDSAQPQTDRRKTGPTVDKVWQEVDQLTRQAWLITIVVLNLERTI